MLRIESRLPDDLEELIHRTIGCCITVHRSLGSGLRERVYAAALRLELAAGGIPFEAEKRCPVFYRGHLLSDQRVDLVVDKRLVLEVKAVDQLARVHRGQALSYLRVSQLTAGLLVNFNVAVLPDGLRRIVL